MKKDFEITKDNYKFYADLYLKLINTKITAKDDVLFYGIPLILSFISGPLILGIGSLIVNEIIATIFTFVSFVSIVFCSMQLSMKIRDYQIKKKNEQIKKQFSNIDTDIDKNVLEESLKKVGILTTKFVNGTYRKEINIKNFEKQLEENEKITKCEEIKQEMLDKNKYNYSSLQYNTNITEQELEKTKVKIKTLIKKRIS